MGKGTTTYRGSDLHSGQARIRDGIINNDNIFSIINASRQSGKSHLLKQLVLYYTINQVNTNVLIVSPFNTQNLKIFDELKNAIIKSGIIKKSNRTEKFIELINGSRITFKPAENPDAIRSGTYNYIFCDELAFFKEGVFFEAILPTIGAVKKAKVFIFSTPRGKNTFYDLSMKGQSTSVEDKNYSYYFMSYTENPLYNIELVDECKKIYPKAKFEQEFLGLFVDSASVFDYEHCAVIEKFQEPEEGMKYYAGLDLARKKDKTVLTIMDEDGNVVLIYSINGVKWNTIVDNVVKLLKKYDAHCLIEINSIGDVVYEMIEKEYHNISPIYTSNSSKQEYIEELIYAFNNCSLTIPVKLLCDDLHLELDVFEFTFSPKTRKVIYAARQGFHDDHVISLALAYKSKKDNISSGDYMIYIDGERI